MQAIVHCVQLSRCWQRVPSFWKPVFSSLIGMFQQFGVPLLLDKHSAAFHLKKYLQRYFKCKLQSYPSSSNLYSSFSILHSYRLQVPILDTLQEC